MTVDITCVPEPLNKFEIVFVVGTTYLILALQYTTWVGLVPLGQFSLFNNQTASFWAVGENQTITPDNG